MQAGIAVFEKLTSCHPLYQDAFGHTRKDYQTVIGPTTRMEGLKPYAWGLSDIFSKKSKAHCDADWEKLYRIQGSSYYSVSLLQRRS